MKAFNLIVGLAISRTELIDRKFTVGFWDASYKRWWRHWENVYKINPGSGLAIYSIHIDLLSSAPNLRLSAWHDSMYTQIFSKASSLIVKHPDPFKTFIDHSIWSQVTPTVLLCYSDIFQNQLLLDCQVLWSFLDLFIKLSSILIFLLSIT